MRASTHSCIARRVRPFAPTAGTVAAALTVPATHPAQVDIDRATSTLIGTAGSLALIPGSTD